MERMTQKEIKRFVALGVAEDITYLSFDACNALRKAHNFHYVKYFYGRLWYEWGFIQG